MIIVRASGRLPSVCFRGASVTTEAVSLLPSSFTNRRGFSRSFPTITHSALDFSFAFGGQRSIQLELLRCVTLPLADWRSVGNGERNALSSRKGLWAKYYS